MLIIFIFHIIKHMNFAVTKIIMHHCIPTGHHNVNMYWGVEIQIHIFRDCILLKVPKLAVHYVSTRLGHPQAYRLKYEKPVVQA